MKNLSLLFICLISTSLFAQKTIADVTLPELQSVQGQKLLLNGGGLREKLWFDLYVGGLYVVSKTTDADKIINANEPMAIMLDIVSGLITSEKMIAAVEEGFEKSTNGNKSKFKNQIADFTSAFKDPIVKGNKFVIAYNTNKGAVVITKNGKEIKSIKGFEFKKVLFAIWIGNQPADEGLKNGMLGK